MGAHRKMASRSWFVSLKDWVSMKLDPRYACLICDTYRAEHITPPPHAHSPVTRKTLRELPAGTQASPGTGKIAANDPPSNVTIVKSPEEFREQ